MKKGFDSTGKVMHIYLKERLVICNDEDTDGRARVTTDEGRVLPEDWTEMILSLWQMVRWTNSQQNFTSISRPNTRPGPDKSTSRLQLRRTYLTMLCCASTFYSLHVKQYSSSVSVGLSVCDTPILYQNGETYRCVRFTLADSPPLL